MFKKYKISNFTGRINAFRVIERLERTEILGAKILKMLRRITIKNVDTSFLFISLIK